MKQLQRNIMQLAWSIYRENVREYGEYPFNFALKLAWHHTRLISKNHLKIAALRHLN